MSCEPEHVRERPASGRQVRVRRRPEVPRPQRERPSAIGKLLQVLLERGELAAIARRLGQHDPLPQDGVPLGLLHGGIRASAAEQAVEPGALGHRLFVLRRGRLVESRLLLELRFRLWFGFGFAAPVRAPVRRAPVPASGSGSGSGSGSSASTRINSCSPRRSSSRSKSPRMAARMSSRWLSSRT